MKFLLIHIIFCVIGWNKCWSDLECAIQSAQLGVIRSASRGEIKIGCSEKWLWLPECCHLKILYIIHKYFASTVIEILISCRLVRFQIQNNSPKACQKKKKKKQWVSKARPIKSIILSGGTVPVRQEKKGQLRTKGWDAKWPVTYEAFHKLGCWDK